ncbi:MAG TPA: cysteine--tRNA ligase [Rhizomicrobium sp.]|jgi:cysteinyl-tRNA synthetase|nr:cysteine--tRNA ligase [Rhizomicrobium sp.]
MTLRLHNTLTRSKDVFVPLDPANVRMYVCGPTVYDFAHIGNARPVIVFDVLFRLLRHLHGETHVSYVRNITDIDDKINARAQELAATRSISVEAARAEITAQTAQQYNDDVSALGCLAPTHTPRATEYVAEMAAMIETLISSGHGYAEQGHVLFDVSSQPDYGKLAHRSLDEMIAGARVDVAPYKRGAMDFVLWKPSDDATPGWDSPWGRGRPGWHIECSAMGEALLGDTFDIHGGGIDLLFPHHENEIAQSECAHSGRPLARYWMHNGFLNVEGEKMSKSLGNFVTIRDLLADWPGDVLRLNMLRSHYRQPIDWTLQGMKESWNVLERWYDIAEPVASRRIGDAVLGALLDDLNTPQAIAELHQSEPEELAGGLALLGFSPDPGRLAARPPVPVEEIADAIAARLAARKAKNFKESDRIRDELLGKGIQLKDNPDGTTGWEVKR